ncbi:hypothetical protein DRH14_03910 [Candidatus Shapirobacteria bacterium]|nr:MAG: hypothetical protein DRH14_03910 [Candidatus Shapirobacteria bacterium]
MLITIIAHPNAKKARIEPDMFGTLHVYVNQPPLEGKANQAIIKSLAKHFSVHHNRVYLTKGHKSKKKTFEISN